jgi:hypothetical protein
MTRATFQRMMTDDVRVKATGSWSTPACWDAGVQTDADPSPAVPFDA